MVKAVIIVSSILTLFIKIGIHIYLDIRNKRFEGLKPFNMLPFLYFFPYMPSVKAIYKNQKRTCNLFYVIFILLLAYSLIFY